MKILCPWNLEFYIPANGFHPLYLPFFEDKKCSAVSFNLLKTESQIWENKSLRNNIVGLSKKIEKKFQRFQPKSLIAREYIEFNNPILHALIKSANPSLIFHHTIPCIPLDCPFFFHCESFLPTFMPFAYQGASNIKNADEVKKFFKRIFESDKCIKIASHLECTLNDFASFFGSKIINNKLIKTKIGLSSKYSIFLTKNKKEKNWDNPTFLFCHSHHQNPNSLVSRGFVIFCKFVLFYTTRYKKGRFIFRCPKISYEECSKNGIDLKLLEQKAGDRIVWIPGYLPENEQLTLFTESEFLILPSSNLHSVTIMQALASGTIPIVTDTFGTDLYIKNKHNGIIIQGMRDVVWDYDREYKYWSDNHNKTKHAESLILNSLCRLFNDNHSITNEWELMSKNALASAQKDFLGEEFCLDLKKQIQTPIIKKSQKKYSSVLIEKCLQQTSEIEFKYAANPRCESENYNNVIISSNGIFSILNKADFCRFNTKLLPPSFVSGKINRSKEIENLVHHLFHENHIISNKSFLGFSLSRTNRGYEAKNNKSHQCITCKSIFRLYLKIFFSKINPFD